MVPAVLLAGDCACDDVKIQIFPVVIRHTGLKTFVHHSGLCIDHLLGPLVADDASDLVRTAVVRTDVATVSQLRLASVANRVVHRKIRSATGNAAENPFKGHADLRPK